MRHLLLLALTSISAIAAPFNGAPSAVPGRIEAEHFDTGTEGIAYHDTSTANTGGANFRSGAVDIEMCADTNGGFDVSWIDAGEWLNFTINVTTAGDYTFHARVASQIGGGSLRAEINGVDKTGTMTVPNTGGWQIWRTISKERIRLEAGVQTMRIYMPGGGFNLNWVQWEARSTPGVGAVQVVLRPDSAVAAGAQFAVDLGTFVESGATVQNLTAGAHTVSFKPIPGFGLPPNLTPIVDAGQTHSLEAWYSIDAPLVQWKLPPTNRVTRRYPKLANYHHGSSNNEDEGVTQLAARLAQWDIVVYGDYLADRHGITASKLRETNPRARVVGYIMYGSGPAYQATLPPVGGSDWYLRDVSGEIQIPWWGAKLMNPYAQDYAYPKYYGELVPRLFYSNRRWDGVFLDVLGEFTGGDVNRDGRLDGTDQQLYVGGNALLLSLLRANNADKLILANAGLPWTRDCPLYPLVNGGMHENALGNEFVHFVPGADTWEFMWTGYTNAMGALTTRPAYHIINGDVQHNRTQAEANTLAALDREDLRRMRLGLCTTLLDEGYFCFDRGDGSHDQLWWFDEYDADLGEALSTYDKDVYARGVYHRYFEHGVVIVNPLNTAVTINLGADARDVTTKIVASVVTIPAQDARILLGDVPLPSLERFAFLRSPGSGLVVEKAATINIEAEAFASAGVARVDLYQGSQLVRSWTAPPYAHAWPVTMASNGVHSWTVKAVDANGVVATSTVADVIVQIPYNNENPIGGLRRRIFRDIAGANITSLTSSPKYPNNPDQDDIVPEFESSDLVSDNYGQVLSGWIIPPETGNYVFHLAADDQAQLFLSTDESPANKRLITQETEWNIYRNWLGFSDATVTRPGRKSAAIPLVGGRWYYVEAIHKEAKGGDHIAVAWQLPGQPPPANWSLPILGKHLAYQLPPRPTLSIAQYAGITIRGQVGDRCRVEYKPDASAALWTTLAKITLETESHLFIDGSAPMGNMRIYQVVLEQ